ncbi:MAG: hypothetical protein QUU85_13770 [Candidatus Eisenbacteria bacterium]|nr:hypothetical protein [Candidatus Eisenbacteria bacterium]
MRIGVVAGVLIAAGGCSSEWGPTLMDGGGGVLHGIVRDSTSGDALPGVLVRQVGTALGTESDRLGGYQMPLDSRSEVLVTFRKEGFRSRSFEVPDQVERLGRREFRKNVEMARSR